MRRLASLTAAAAVALVIAATAAGVAASPAAAAWNCTTGYCSWGYNYIGSGVNQYVSSPWNYWYDQYLDKQSGDTIQIGIGPQDGCYINRSGVGTWYMVISAAPPNGYGCGGYIYHYMAWYTGYGNTSYLFVDTYT